MDFDIIGVTLHTLGVSSKYQGFTYLNDAIKLMLNEEEYRHGALKRIYEAIAIKYNCSPGSVERNIRTCIENSWYRIGNEVVKELFGNTLSYLEDRPTNGDYIYNLYDYLMFNNDIKNKKL